MQASRPGLHGDQLRVTDSVQRLQTSAFTTVHTRKKLHEERTRDTMGISVLLN